MEGSWAHDHFRYSFEVAGSGGLYEFDSDKVKPVVISRREGEGAGPAGVPVPESPLRESPYTAELRHFGECLRSGAQPVVTAEDAYRALEISLAAIESARTGRPITLSKEAI